jgi:D-glucuronyl C5-epimerase C-terminus.
MYQGVVISTLIRGYRINGDQALLDLSKRATIVFSQDIEKGGVRTYEKGGTLYEEYPAYPLPRVLDGFLFSLLGLYDLAIETGSPDIRRLFDEVSMD